MELMRSLSFSKRFNHLRSLVTPSLETQILLMKGTGQSSVGSFMYDFIEQILKRQKKIMGQFTDATSPLFSSKGGI